MSELEILAKKENVNVISSGYNMDCKYVMVKGVLYFDEGRFCLKTKGIDMYYDDTSDLLLDTEENRKLLRLQLKVKNKDYYNLQKILNETVVTNK